MGYSGGKWEVDNRERNGYFGLEKLDKDIYPFIINMPSFSICGRAGAIVSAGLISKDEAEANAHLIAAAPKMYEALNFFVCQLEPWIKLCPKIEPWVQVAKEEGMKALAKAKEGRSSGT